MPAQTQEALLATGESLGVAVLVIDAAIDEAELSSVPRLAALAATDIEMTLQVLADPAWLEGDVSVDLEAIEAELRAIAAIEGFHESVARLRKTIRELPTWQHLVRLQNDRLLVTIRNDAWALFRTAYAPSAAIPRTLEAELDMWAEACLKGESCEVAVVTGDRYDGKTWLVYHWLETRLPSLAVPVFFFPSRRVLSERGNIERLIDEDLSRAAGSFRRRVDVLLERRRSRTDGAHWAIIVLDGANEYAADRPALDAAVAQAGPTGMPPAGQAALLMTCRTADFKERSRWLGNREVRRLELNPYDDIEFPQALKRNGRTDAAFAPSGSKERIFIIVAAMQSITGLLFRSADLFGLEPETGDGGGMAREIPEIASSVGYCLTDSSACGGSSTLQWMMASLIDTSNSCVPVSYGDRVSPDRRCGWGYIC